MWYTHVYALIGYIYTLSGRKNFLPFGVLQAALRIDMKQINRRESNKSLIPCTSPVYKRPWKTE